MNVRAVCGALLLLAATGCGTATSQSDGPGASAAKPKASTVVDDDQTAADGLTCKDGARSVGFPDFFDDSGGAESPEAAARSMAGPSDGVVVQDESSANAVAYLLREDETAYLRLDLITLRDGTWRVDTFTACPGEGPGSRR